MTFQKFQASQLFTGTEMLGPDAVLITDAAGKVEAIIDKSAAGEGIQQLEGILSPGFINCHCHLELSHMLGRIPEKTGLVDFVFAVVKDRHFPEEEILAAIESAETQMLSNGIVAVGDICNHMLTLPQKQKERLAYYNFIELTGFLPALAQTRFDKSFEYYQAFQHQTPNPQSQRSEDPANSGTPNRSEAKIPRIAGPQTSLSPHAPYSVSNELWALMMPYFKGNSITIHNQETAFEDSLFKNKQGDFIRMYQLMQMDTSFFQPTGKNSLQSYLSKMKDAAQILLVHNTFTREEDIRFAATVSDNINWCLCINANQYIEQALPPVDLLRQYNANIVLGTDSLASNHSLSILDEIKTLRKYFPDIPLTEVLTWATLNGARALQMDNSLGSFEPGKKPGVVSIVGMDDSKGFAKATVSRVL